jgi:hypothetical protein
LAIGSTACPELVPAHRFAGSPLEDDALARAVAPDELLMLLIRVNECATSNACDHNAMPDHPSCRRRRLRDNGAKWAYRGAQRTSDSPGINIDRREVKKIIECNAV